MIENYGFNDLQYQDKQILMGFIAMIVIAINGSWSIWLQARKVLVNQDDQCLPFPTYLAQAVTFGITIIYGFKQGLLAMMLSGIFRILVIIFLIYLILKVNQYKKFMVWQVALSFVALCLTAIPALTEIMMVLVLLIGLVYFCKMPIDMIRKNTRGDISLPSQVLLLIGQLIWVIYGYLMGDKLIYISSALITFIPISIILIWPFVPPKENLTKKR